MSWISAATLGSAVVGGISANKAANAQTAAANRQLALQREVYDDATARFEPFVSGGTNAFNALQFEQGLGARPEGYAGMSLSPGAKFAMEQGRDTIEAGAAGRGNLFSGASMQALEGMRQGTAAQDRGNQLNRLTQLAGFGQASAGQQAVAGQNLATGGGNAMANIGNAQAAGAIGFGNQIQSGINNGLQLYTNNQQQQNNAWPNGGQQQQPQTNTLSGYNRGY